MASIDKIDMSLDDIIKLNKKTKLQQKKQASGKRFAIGTYRQLKQFRGRVGKTRLAASRAFTQAKLAGVSPLNRTRKTPRQATTKFNYQYPSKAQQNFLQRKRQQGYVNLKQRQRTGRQQQQQLPSAQKKKAQYNIATKRQGRLRRGNFQQGKLQRRYGSLLPRQQTKQKLSWRQPQNAKQQWQQKIRQKWQQNQATKKRWQTNRGRFQQNKATKQMWQQNAKIKQSWFTRKQQKRSRQSKVNEGRGFSQQVTQARPQQSRGWKLTRNYGRMRSDVIASQQRQQRQQLQQRQQQQRQQQQRQQRQPRRRQWGSTVTNSEGSILKISVVNDPPGYQNSDVQVQLKATRPVEKQQRIQLSKPRRQIEAGMSFDERFTRQSGGGGDGIRQVFL